MAICNGMDEPQFFKTIIVLIGITLFLFFFFNLVQIVLRENILIFEFFHVGDFCLNIKLCTDRLYFKNVLTIHVINQQYFTIFKNFFEANVYK